jgi:hypothetical protein
MRNFEHLSDIIEYVNTLDFINEKLGVLDIKESSASNLLFVANKYLDTTEQKIYEIPILYITILSSKDNEKITVFHIYIPSRESAMESIIDDIGNHVIQASWGTSQSQPPKIYSWDYLQYQITLRKNFKIIKDYEIKSTVDVITISTFT